MWWKRAQKTRPHDLRDEMFGRISVPSGSAKPFGVASDENPHIVSPDVTVHTPGQTTHE